jgi:hypothetical protein
MITEKRGDAAVAELALWANRIARAVDERVGASVYYDADSSTYVLRLEKGSHVLLFRLSESQVHTSSRETECERTLKRKTKDLVG